MSVDVTWYGHATTGVTTPMVKILIDPWFDDNPMASAKAEEVEADVIIVTHGHHDHLGDTVAIARRTGALVISNFEIVTYLGREETVEGANAPYRGSEQAGATPGLKNLHAMHIGGAHSFDWGQVKLTPALHGSSMPDGSYGGLAAGVLLYLGGIRIYHAGDTGLFSDMQLIGEPDLDLALIPIGDNFTMGPDDALLAVKYLQPKHVIPLHYDTFELIAQDVGEWAGRVDSRTGATPHVLTAGESFTIDND